MTEPPRPGKIFLQRMPATWGIWQMMKMSLVLLAGFLVSAAFGSESPEQLADQVLVAYQNHDAALMKTLVLINEKTRYRNAVELLLPGGPGEGKPYVRSSVVTPEERGEMGDALVTSGLNAQIAGYLKMETEKFEGQPLAAVFLAYGCVGGEYLLLTLAKE